MIDNLLVVDVNKRLGCLAGGVNDIKQHRWFVGIDWDSLPRREKPGPLNPGVMNEGDTHNFYHYYSDTNVHEEQDPSINYDEIFADF